MKKFYGTGVAIITPFKKDFSIDFSSLERLINFNIENGINYFVVLGTTGESVTLSKEEKKSVWKFVAEKVNARVPLVAGIGGNDTSHVEEDIKEFDTRGYDAILSVSPYYNKPSQEGIFQHYSKLAAASPLPIIIYNVPGRTASNISAETILRLAKFTEKFIGVKEASGNISQIMHIIKDKPTNFLVISGDDLITLPMISFGAVGVISVVAQATPKKFSAMVDASLKGNFEEAKNLHYQLLNCMELFFEEGSPAGVKAALNVLGYCENVLRLPLVKTSDSLYEKIKAEL